LLEEYFGMFGEECSDENTPGKGDLKVSKMLSYRIAYA